MRLNHKIKRGKQLQQQQFNGQNQRRSTKNKNRQRERELEEDGEKSQQKSILMQDKRAIICYDRKSMDKMTYGFCICVINAPKTI